jgi:hypothetical protein
MGADEHQRKPPIRDLRLVGSGIQAFGPKLQLASGNLSSVLSPHSIDCFPPRNGQKPGLGIRWTAL